MLLLVSPVNISRFLFQQPQPTQSIANNQYCFGALSSVCILSLSLSHTHSHTHTHTCVVNRLASCLINPHHSFRDHLSRFVCLFVLPHIYCILFLFQSFGIWKDNTPNSLHISHWEKGEINYPAVGSIQRKCHGFARYSSYSRSSFSLWSY